MELIELEVSISMKVTEIGLEHPVELIISISGLDYLSTVTVACELGSVDRFKLAREAIAICGLTPRLHGSAGWIRSGQITIHGSSSVHRALYVVFKTVIRFIPKLKEFYFRIKVNHQEMIDLIAFCRKLIELC